MVLKETGVLLDLLVLLGLLDLLDFLVPWVRKDPKEMREQSAQ